VSKSLDSNLERAYRRGVCQAFVYLDRFIHNEKYLHVDPASVIDVFKSVAHTIRFENKEHGLLMDEIVKRSTKLIDEAGLLDKLEGEE